MALCWRKVIGKNAGIYVVVFLAKDAEDDPLELSGKAMASERRNKE
jgi:hypothetical protein